MKWEIYGDVYPISRPKQVPRVYLRYGLFSGMRSSSNHSTGHSEIGLSVYPGEYCDGAVGLAEDVETSDQLIGQNRLCIPVTGREVGIGSDGEPVLTNVRVLPYAVFITAKR